MHHYLPQVLTDRMTTAVRTRENEQTYPNETWRIYLLIERLSTLMVRKRDNDFFNMISMVKLGNKALYLKVQCIF